MSVTEADSFRQNTRGPQDPDPPADAGSPARPAAHDAVRRRTAAACWPPPAEKRHVLDEPTNGTADVEQPACSTACGQVGIVIAHHQAVMARRSSICSGARHDWLRHARRPRRPRGRRTGEHLGAAYIAGRGFWWAAGAALSIVILTRSRGVRPGQTPSADNRIMSGRQMRMLSPADGWAVGADIPQHWATGRPPVPAQISHPQ